MATVVLPFTSPLHREVIPLERSQSKNLLNKLLRSKRSLLSVGHIEISQVEIHSVELVTSHTFGLRISYPSGRDNQPEGMLISFNRDGYQVRYPELVTGDWGSERNIRPMGSLSLRSISDLIREKYPFLLDLMTARRLFVPSELVSDEMLKLQRRSCVTDEDWPIHITNDEHIGISSDSSACSCCYSSEDEAQDRMTLVGCRRSFAGYFSDASSSDCSCCHSEDDEDHDRDPFIFGPWRMFPGYFSDDSRHSSETEAIARYANGYGSDPHLNGDPCSECDSESEQEMIVKRTRYAYEFVDTRGLIHQTMMSTDDKGNSISTTSVTASDGTLRETKFDVMIGGQTTLEGSINRDGDLLITTEDKSKSTCKTEVYGYKVAETEHGEKCLIKLLIPKDAKVEAEFGEDKVRCNKVKVVSIWKYEYVGDYWKDIENNVRGNIKYIEEVQVAHSCVYNKAKIFYRTGETYEEENFTSSAEVCKPGIHFCWLRSTALGYHGIYNVMESDLPEEPFSKIYEPRSIEVTEPEQDDTLIQEISEREGLIQRKVSKDKERVFD